MKKHADQDQFFSGSNEFVLCYPDQSIVKFILGTSIEFTGERYKEEIRIPYLKIDLYLCNVDGDVNLKVIDDNKVTIHDNLDQTISNQLIHEQNTNSNPTQGQQEVRLTLPMMKMVLFPSVNFIQSLTGSYVEDVHRLFESSLKSEEEPCCSRNINPVIERKVYCSICNNPFSVSTIEEHADLCLENKSKLFFERQLKSSDDKKSVSMIDEKTEMRGHLDQTKLVPAIYKKCEMMKKMNSLSMSEEGFALKIS